MWKAGWIPVLTAAYAAGVWLAAAITVWLPGLYVAAGLCAAAALYGVRRESRYTIAVLGVLFLSMGMIRYSHDDAVSPADISRYSGQAGTVAGMVAAAPQVRLNGETASVQYIVAVDSIAVSSRELPATGKMIVSVRQPREKGKIAQYGDQVAVTGTVLLPQGYKNPGAFDTVAALKRQGVTARLAASGDALVITSALQTNWRTVISEYRDRLLAAMNQAMSSGQAAVLFGMLFGGYNGIDPAVIADFSATGLVHILSVSGTHVALVAGVIYACGRWLGLGDNARAAVAAAFILAYGLLAGFSPPVVRSVIMGLIALGAVVLKREQDGQNSLAVAGLGMLIWQPALLFDISFQLSYAATAGLVFLYPRLSERLAKMPACFAEPVAITLAAQASVLPFLAWHFNTVSMSAFIANIFITPILEGLVVAGLAGVLLAGVWALAGKIILALCGLCISGVLSWISLLADMPGGTVYVPSLSVLGGLAYYFLLVWLFGYRPGGVPDFCETVKRHKTASMAAGLLVLVFIAWQYRPQPVYVHFIDVGQGDATLVITPHGKAVLIDTGGIVSQSSQFDVGQRVVVPYLRHYGIRSLEYLFLTHGHQDHAGGAAAIAAELPVKHLVLPQEGWSPAVKSLLRNSGNAVYIPAFAGQTVTIDGVVFEIVHAPSANGRNSRNEVSAVIRVAYGSHSFLLTGDLEADGEDAIISGKTAVASTVLKVGHHGSRTSTTPAFLQAVAPAAAVISVGADNRFGHPHREVLERLAEQNIAVYRTDKQGAVVLQTDGKYLKASPFIR